jgi:hypothetical protein
VVRSGERRSSINRTPSLNDLAARREKRGNMFWRFVQRGTTALAGECGRLVIVIHRGDVGQGGRICEVGRTENVKSAE